MNLALYVAGQGYDTATLTVMSRNPSSVSDRLSQKGSLFDSSPSDR